MPNERNTEMQIPEKYKHDTKIMHCRECGRPMRVGIRTRKTPRCIECGIDTFQDTHRQMIEKSGPRYDKWLASMQRAFGGGPPGGGASENDRGTEPKE